MLDQKLARMVLEEALGTGGDFSELFVEDTEQNNVTMMDGKVENATYSRVHGAGVRVLKGTRSAYAYTANTSEEALRLTARAAAAALKGVKEGESVEFACNNYGGAPQIPFSDIGNADRIALLREGTAAAKAYSGEITQVAAKYLDVDQRIMVCNNLGVWAEDRRPRTRIFIQAVASDSDEAQTGSMSPGYGMGFETYRRHVDAGAAGEQAARTAVTMLHAEQCPAGIVPVVIDGGFGGVILHEACVHSLEATSVAKGNSEFCGKLGQKVASAIVTAVDDGTMPGDWGSINVDDEGNLPRRTGLIENGILKSYLVDILGARSMNHPVTGSGRREGYAFAPTSRMTNTFFAPGSDDEEEMIATMGDGLFAARMGGGSVNPLTGEFNFAVLEGYWVKNGKIHCPVRGATLVGRGADVIQKIDRIGKKMWMGQGMCGSLSGSVPTNVGQPRIRVSEITVGGKGGAL